MTQFVEDKLKPAVSTRKLADAVDVDIDPPLSNFSPTDVRSAIERLVSHTQPDEIRDRLETLSGGDRFQAGRLRYRPANHTADVNITSSNIENYRNGFININANNVDVTIGRDLFHEADRLLIYNGGSVHSTVTVTGGNVNNGSGETYRIEARQLAVMVARTGGTLWAAVQAGVVTLPDEGTLAELEAGDETGVRLFSPEAVNDFVTNITDHLDDRITEITESGQHTDFTQVASYSVRSAGFGFSRIGDMDFINDTLFVMSEAGDLWNGTFTESAGLAGTGARVGGLAFREISGTLRMFIGVDNAIVVFDVGPDANETDTHDFQGVQSIQLGGSGTIEAMAVDDTTLYLAVRESGIYTVRTATSDVTAWPPTFVTRTLADSQNLAGGIGGIAVNGDHLYLLAFDQSNIFEDGSALILSYTTAYARDADDDRGIATSTNTGLIVRDTEMFIGQSFLVLRLAADTASAFTDHTDTPDDYEGFAGQLVVVNEEEDGVDFAVASEIAGLTDHMVVGSEIAAGTWDIGQTGIDLALTEFGSSSSNYSLDALDDSFLVVPKTRPGDRVTGFTFRLFDSTDTLIDEADLLFGPEDDFNDGGATAGGSKTVLMPTASDRGQVNVGYLARTGVPRIGIGTTNGNLATEVHTIRIYETLAASSQVDSDFPTEVHEFTAQQGFLEVELTDAATIDWDLDNAQSAKVTIGGDRTLANPTNQKAGFTYRLEVVQDGTGSRMLSYGGNYQWLEGNAPVLPTAADASFIIYFDSDGTTMRGIGQGPFT